jgi:DNA-binding LacI/PurR family transcriptional regulator
MNSRKVHQSSGAPAGRKSRSALVTSLRKMIVGGRYRPGDRLPTRDELVSHYGASKHTVQAALVRLGDEGFVVARTKAGTFVVERPPHLTRYALVFPMRVGRSIFYEALREAARDAAARRNIDFIEYDQEADDDMARLRADARDHLLAGAVFVHAINRMWNTPMMTEPGAPKVFIQTSAALPFPDLHVDMDSFYRRAFALAREAGRRRLAVIYGNVPWGQWTPERFACEAAEAGLRLEPYRLAPVGGHAPQATVAFAVQAMMALQGDRRPDALVIADDNYLLAAAGGLMSADVQVPRDLLVIAHTNFPLPGDTPGLPVTHLGFDLGAMIDHAVDILGTQRDGQPPDPAWLKPLAAVLSHELPVATHAAGVAASAAVRPAAPTPVSVYEERVTVA